MKRYRLFPILLAVLLLAGCGSAKPVTSKKLASEVEKRGAVTETVKSGDMFSSDYPEALVSRVLFSNNDEGWSGVFWEFDSVAAAKMCFARLNGASEASSGFSPNEDYDRFEITLAKGAQPVIRAIRVRDTVLLVARRDDEGSREAVSKLLSSLGYN